VKWFWQKDPPQHSPDDELAKARAQREEAERRLRESQIAARQVRQVTIRAAQIRTDNQFSSRLDQVFRSRPQNG
jgi:hypothetical protein